MLKKPPSGYHQAEINSESTPKVLIIDEPVNSPADLTGSRKTHSSEAMKEAIAYESTNKTRNIRYAKAIK